MSRNFVITERNTPRNIPSFQQKQYVPQQNITHFQTRSKVLFWKQCHSFKAEAKISWCWIVSFSTITAITIYHITYILDIVYKKFCCGWNSWWRYRAYMMVRKKFPRWINIKFTENLRSNLLEIIRALCQSRCTILKSIPNLQKLKNEKYVSTGPRLHSNNHRKLNAHTVLIVFHYFQKCLQFQLDDTVWMAKQRVLSSMARVRINTF